MTILSQYKQFCIWLNGLSKEEQFAIRELVSEDRARDNLYVGVLLAEIPALSEDSAVSVLILAASLLKFGVKELPEQKDIPDYLLCEQAGVSLQKALLPVSTEGTRDAYFNRLTNRHLQHGDPVYLRGFRKALFQVVSIAKSKGCAVGLFTLCCVGSGFGVQEQRKFTMGFRIQKEFAEATTEV